jgi:hypothetical protein
MGGRLVLPRLVLLVQFQAGARHSCREPPDEAAALAAMDQAVLGQDLLDPGGQRQAPIELLRGDAEASVL